MLRANLVSALWRGPSLSWIHHFMVLPLGPAFCKAKRWAHRLAHIRGHFVSPALASAEAQFVRENSAFWAQHAGTRQQGGSNRYVLVEEQYHPVILLCNASLATIVASARDLRPLFVLHSHRGSSIRKILESYPNAAFVCELTLRNVIPWIAARIHAWWAFRRLRSPEDVLQFQVDGIRFGDLIYDAVLAQGYATIDRVDNRVLTVLRSFFFYRHVARAIIKRHSIDTSVFSHLVGLKSGTFARYLLQARIEVVLRTGSHQVQLKKYHDLRDVGKYPLRPEPHYFEFMMHDGSRRMHRLADEFLDGYMNCRLDRRTHESAIGLAYGHGSRTFTSHEEFCREFDLDAAKLTVFVMLHEFTDFPHSHFARPMIFRDYCDWFKRTLQIAKSVHSVNWVFKEHPASEHYPTKDLDLDALFAGVQERHIRFLSRRSQFKTRSLEYLAHAIVTCLGTAGLEYSCLGVPAVLAGESPYSGFGFTVEPQDAVEYEDHLRRIAELGRLREDQTRAARVVMFFQQGMMQGAKYWFCPYFDQRQIREMPSDDLWREAASLLRDGDRTCMTQQIKILSDFVGDRSYTQFIDIEKYAFMEAAIQQARQPACLQPQDPRHCDVPEAEQHVLTIKTG